MDDKNAPQGLGDEIEQDANDTGNAAGSGASQMWQMFPTRQNQQKDPTDGGANPAQTDGTRPAKQPPNDLSSPSPRAPDPPCGGTPTEGDSNPLKDLLNKFAANRSGGGGNNSHGSGGDGHSGVNHPPPENAAANTAGGSTGAGASSTGAAGNAGASSASAGAQAGTQTGTQAGAQAGSQAAANTAAASSAAGGAAAPGIGTAVGAVMGVVVVEGGKILFKLLVALMVVVSIFTLLPSSLFDKSEAVLNRDTLEKVYTSFYESFEDQYRKDIADTMDNKANTVTHSNNSTLISTEGAPFDTEYGRVELKGAYLVAYNSAFSADLVEYSSPVYDFLFTKEQYLAKMTHNINMMICMSDAQKKNWFVQVVVWILDTATGGWFSDFAKGLSQKWEGFWVDYIALRIEETTASVSWSEREVPGYDENGSLVYTTITVATVTFGFVYDLHDKGVAHFAQKMALTDEQYDRAVEMAGYVGELFGTEGEYLGWYVDDDGEHYTDPLPGGSTGDKILAGTENLGDRINDFHWNPDAPTAFPLPGHSGLTPTSRFGPRNYARDPYHTGTDFSFGGCKGTPVVAVQDGMVIMKLAKSTGFGNHLAIFHGDGISTMYAHMDKFGKFGVGDTVSRGDTIGYVGTTGESTGPHLHIEFRKNGTPLNPIGNLNCFDYLL